MERDDSQDSHLLETLFRCKVGQIPDRGLAKVIRGVDPFRSTLEEVEAMAKVSGSKPKVRGLTKPAHMTEARLRAAKKNSEMNGGLRDPRIK